METEILLIRHAKSIANETGIFGGITDYDLSMEGIEQAERLADRFKEYKIDKIYSSPLKRAIKTITPTAKIKNEKINVIDDLREIYVGTWENISRDELRKMFPTENEYIDRTEHYIGMIGQEETIDAANRMYEAIRKIAIDNNDKTVAVISHVVAMCAFLCKIMGIPFEETKNRIGKIRNTSITKIVYKKDKDKFEVKYIGK